MELDAGTDLIKLALESGYAASPTCPTSLRTSLMPSSPQPTSVVLGSVLTYQKVLQRLIEAGVDDLAHIPNDFLSAINGHQLVDRHIYVCRLSLSRGLCGGLTGSTQT